MTFNRDHALETYRSLISISIEFLRALLLLNGGAIVALLAYLGQVENGAEIAAHSSQPLAWFVAGLVLSTAALVGSYLTQLSLYQERVHSETYKGSHVPWLRGTILIGILALGAFSVGAFSGIALLSKNGGTPKLAVGEWYETESGETLRYAGSGKLEARPPLSSFERK